MELQDFVSDSSTYMIDPTWRIMGLSKYGYKYFKWGNKQLQV